MFLLVSIRPWTLPLSIVQNCFVEINKKHEYTILQLEWLAQKQKSGHASLHPGLMCNDMSLSIASESIIWGKKLLSSHSLHFSLPTLPNLQNVRCFCPRQQQSHNDRHSNANNGACVPRNQFGQRERTHLDQSIWISEVAITQSRSDKCLKWHHENGLSDSSSISIFIALLCFPQPNNTKQFKSESFAFSVHNHTQSKTHYIPISTRKPLWKWLPTLNHVRHPTLLSQKTSMIALRVKRLSILSSVSPTSLEKDLRVP